MIAKMLSALRGRGASGCEMPSLGVFRAGDWAGERRLRVLPGASCCQSVRCFCPLAIV